MDRAIFEQLLATPAVLAAAAEVRPTEATFLAAYETLRKRYPPPLAKAAIEISILRDRARVKFTQAERMFFTREALEQASAEPVAQHRAARFASFRTVVDLGCGIGGDALALAAQGGCVTAVDLDPLRCGMAAANAAALGRPLTVLTADVLGEPLAAEAAFCDPARRAGGRRYRQLADYQPPPAAVLARYPRIPLAFKLAPGVPRDSLATGLHAPEMEIRDWVSIETRDETRPELPAVPLAAGPAEVEFVSLAGELKECVLWLRDFYTADRRATVLPTGATLSGRPSEPEHQRPIGAYLYDPDAAVVRAELVGLLAAQLDLAAIDAGNSLLTGDTLHASPFVTVYRVEAVLPFHVKQLGEALRHRRVGRVTIVKRAAPDRGTDVNELQKRWKLSGADHRFVVLTREAGAAVAVIGERVAPVIAS